MYVSKHLEASESRVLNARIGPSRSAWRSRWSGRLKGEVLKSRTLPFAALKEGRTSRAKRDGEIGNRVPLVSEGVDLQGEDVSTPAVRDGLLHVPTARGGILYLLHQDDMMRPRDSPEHRATLWGEGSRSYFRGEIFATAGGEITRLGILAEKPDHPVDVALGEPLLISAPRRGCDHTSRNRA